ncbi:MAG: hypothetical protein KBD62_35225 [Kofleriaceae bacterium]|nr:hypothetical protein [Kofleriaceae bacterium]
MTATQDIQFGITGQTLVFDCEDGRPASVASVAVYEADDDDDSTPETATTGAASVETNPNTTISASASAGAETITVTSATGATVGRTYRLADASGLFEDLTVTAVSGTTVTSRTPLINGYASGATFKSCRASIALDATWVADTNNASPSWCPNPRYRVRWVIVDSAGATQAYHRFFDLVRYPARHGVIPTMVEARHPGWLDGLPIDSRSAQGRALIDRAFAQLKVDLYADNKADQATRNAELVSELVIEKAAVLAVEDAIRLGATNQGTRYDQMQALYKQRYDQLVRAPVLPMDTAGAGATTTNRPTPIWRR